MTKAQHFAAVLRLGDDALVLGQRLSAWCGHGPILEEDIALSNIALDLIGQARNFFTLAGTLENEGRDEDALAYFRSDREFQNHLLVEQPNGHFGDTVVRQMFFSAFALDRYMFLAHQTVNSDVAGIAASGLERLRVQVWGEVPKLGTTSHLCIEYAGPRAIMHEQIFFEESHCFKYCW